VDSSCVSFHNVFLPHLCTNSVPFVPQVAPMLSSSSWIFKENLARSTAVQQHNSTAIQQYSNIDVQQYSSTEVQLYKIRRASLCNFLPLLLFTSSYFLPSTTFWNTTSLCHSHTARDQVLDTYETKRNITFLYILVFYNFIYYNGRQKILNSKEKAFSELNFLNLFVIQHR